MADSKKPLASVEDAEKASQERVKPGDKVTPDKPATRESDPERVAKAVESAKPEVRDEQPEVREEVVAKVEGDTVQPWAAGTSNATTLTHSSLELAPTLTESQKATRRRI